MVTAMRTASWTTWLLVRIRPSGVKTNPEPPPRRSCGSPERVRPARLMHFDIHHRRAHALDRAGYRGRIRIQQGIVGDGMGFGERFGVWASGAGKVQQGREGHFNLVDTHDE